MVIIWWPLTSVPEAWDSSVGRNRPTQLQTRDQFFPLRETTHSQSHEETPGKIILPSCSHLKTFGKDAQFFFFINLFHDAGTHRRQTQRIRSRSYSKDARSEVKCSLHFPVTETADWTEEGGETVNEFNRTQPVSISRLDTKMLFLLIHTHREDWKRL